MSRRAFIVLAFLALAVALAAPVCDAFDSHVDIAQSSSHSGDSGICCADLDDGQAVKSAAVLLPSFEARLPLLSGATQVPALRPHASLSPSLLWRGRAAIPLPYHARSARILL